MKKAIYVLCVLFCIHATEMTAQQEYVWEHYKMSIELPNDFKVVKNTDDEFHCEGDGMELYMLVFENADLTARDMRKATKELAKQLNFELKDEEYNITAHDGFEGKYILGVKDGKQMMICGLINTKNATNFWILIEFEDGDHTAEDEGIKILNSLENEG